MLRDKLDRARQAYGEKLAERVRELIELMRRVGAGEVGALETAQRLAHRIYGSAGTFGFTAVGEAARDIDQQLLRVLAGELQMTGELVADLIELLGRARAAIDTSAGD